MEKSWIVVLGSTDGLATFELSSLFPETPFERLSGPCVFLKNVAVNPEELREIAGGIVKIAAVVSVGSEVTAQILADILLLRSTDTSNIVFGISRYDGEKIDPTLLRDIKKYLEQQGKRVRYIAPKEGELSSVVIQKQAVQELIVTKGKEGVLVGATIAVQDFESWGKRDYGRPFADPKLGMLPPKVARMAVNLAIGREGKGKVILDPFCGMGTILAEGLMRGCHAIGSDVSEDVVTKARKNLEWLVSQYPSIHIGAYNLTVSDATHISEHLKPDSADAIVTEPFMGSPILGEKRITDPAKIKGIVKGLEKLYIGCLKDWSKVIKSGGRVVIALPEFAIGGRTYFVKRVVDNCENLGYSKVRGPIEYSRPQAIVKREFYVFRKK